MQAGETPRKSNMLRCFLSHKKSWTLQGKQRTFPDKSLSIFKSIWWTIHVLSIFKCSKFYSYLKKYLIFFFFFVFVFLVFLPALWCRLIFMWLSAACQAPLSMEFSRQYWSGWPFPSPGDLLSPGIELDFSCTGRWILYRCTNWEAQLYGDINWHLIV